MTAHKSNADSVLYMGVFLVSTCTVNFGICLTFPYRDFSEYTCGLADDTS
jgi:hypothetical protein